MVGDISFKLVSMVADYVTYDLVYHTDPTYCTCCCCCAVYWKTRLSLYLHNCKWYRVDTWQGRSRGQALAIDMGWSHPPTWGVGWGGVVVRGGGWGPSWAGGRLCEGGWDMIIVIIVFLFFVYSFLFLSYFTYLNSLSKLFIVKILVHVNYFTKQIKNE